MTRNDFDNSLKVSAECYYNGDHFTGDYLMNGCIRWLSFSPMTKEQIQFVNNQVAIINTIRKSENYTRLADFLSYELLLDFPNLDSLIGKAE